MRLTLGGAEVEGESRSRRDGAGDKSNQKVIKQEERKGSSGASKELLHKHLSHRGLDVDEHELDN